ncbi:hypothetical protein [Saonia flava]|nr:hypothetical protein [Saonia flava]
MAQTNNLTEHSVIKPIKHLKLLLEKNETTNFQVQIINRHNGEYRINSLIELDKDKVSIKSHINDMTNTSSDINLNYSKDKFIEKLENLLTHTGDFYILAGHYQNIQIEQGSTIVEYLTRDAHGLINLLNRDDKSN